MAMPGSSKATRFSRRAFPSSFSRPVAGRTSSARREANYHVSFLPKIAALAVGVPAASRPAMADENAQLIRPLFSQCRRRARDADGGGGRHALFAQDRLAQGLPARKDASRLLRASATWRAKFGMPLDVARHRQARALEPSLTPVFAHGVFWPQAASISKPLGVTRAYVARFEALGGVLLHGDARTLHRNGSIGGSKPTKARSMPIRSWSRSGPGRSDLLEPLGIKLPLAVKRGYHRHFRAQGNASLSRPVLDADVRLLITPMEQGIRITTGAEIAPRDAPADAGAVRPYDASALRELFPLGERADDKTWMGSRALLARFPSGDRPCARTVRAVAGGRTRALGPDARPCYWPARCGNDSRRNTVL